MHRRAKMAAEPEFNTCIFRLEKQEGEEEFPPPAKDAKPLGVIFEDPASDRQPDGHRNLYWQRGAANRKKHARHGHFVYQQ